MLGLVAGCIDVASRGQVMGQQFGLAFDEIGTSQRRKYGTSPDSPPEWIRTFSSALDGRRFHGFVRIGSDLPARRSCEQLPASAYRSRVGRRSEEPPLTARIRRRHTTAALSAVQARRGTEGSNPFPSSGESYLERAAGRCAQCPLTSRRSARANSAMFDFAKTSAPASRSSPK